MLQAMLEKLDPLLKEEDILLFIGDYVDRGEDSNGVLDTLLELREQRPNTVFLRGNHEQLMLGARDGEAPEIEGPELLFSEKMELWLINGGDRTLLSYREAYTAEDFLRWWESIPEAHWTFLQETRMEYSTPRYH